jgi:hypothetical protein
MSQDDHENGGRTAGRSIGSHDSLQTQEEIDAELRIRLENAKAAAAEAAYERDQLLAEQQTATSEAERHARQAADKDEEMDAFFKKGNAHAEEADVASQNLIVDGIQTIKDGVSAWFDQALFHSDLDFGTVKELLGDVEELAEDEYDQATAAVRGLGDYGKAALAGAESWLENETADDLREQAAEAAHEAIEADEQREEAENNQEDAIVQLVGLHGRSLRGIGTARRHDDDQPDEEHEYDLDLEDETSAEEDNGIDELSKEDEQGADEEDDCIGRNEDEYAVEEDESAWEVPGDDDPVEEPPYGGDNNRDDYGGGGGYEREAYDGSGYGGNYDTGGYDETDYGGGNTDHYGYDSHDGSGNEEE